MENTITITVEEYKKLLEVSIRIDAFSSFANQEKYSINKEDCARFLGIEIKED